MLAAKRKELRAINLEIANRKQYRVDQERQIAEAAESGNTQLMGLAHDVLVAQEVLRQLKTDIRTAKQDKKLLNQDLEELREELGQIGNMSTVPAFG